MDYKEKVIALLNSQELSKEQKEKLEEIFPELAESEDERIKKCVKYAIDKLFLKEKIVCDVHKNDVLAWLEKQDEKKPADKEYTFKAIPRLLEMIQPTDRAKSYCQKLIGSLEQEGYSTDAKIVRDCLKQMNGEKVAMATMDEQKPDDKVEPKFHKGDWVVYCNDDVDLITGIEENGYSINNGGYIPFICENEMRLWDITDAKVGDVLVSESNCGLNTWYCIFKSLDDDESMTVYCYLARDGRFETKKESCFDKDPYNTKPATKEQRDTLMKAIADAGYTFDFDKKELKKIEQKPAWSEEDELIVAKILCICNDFERSFESSLSSTKVIKEDVDKIDNWLKSLKERYTWKPSDEQMVALNNAILLNEDHYNGAVLSTLREQLKKLREE